MTLDRFPEGLAALHDDIGRQLLTRHNAADMLIALTRTAVGRVPGAEWASVTEGRGGAFRTLAATDPLASIVDEIQYELGTGPCVDAILQETTYRTADLVTDPRWPEFGRRATAATPVRSMLSFRLFLEDGEVIAGLNLYSTRVDAFDAEAEVIGTLVATHGALAMVAIAARERASQLQQAVQSNREIGVAMGILMARHRITREEAFGLLRVASQTTNRKLAEIAVEVGDAGALELPGRSGGPADPRPPRRGQRPR